MQRLIAANVDAGSVTVQTEFGGTTRQKQLGRHCNEVKPKNPNPGKTTLTAAATALPPARHPLSITSSCHRQSAKSEPE